MLPTLYLSCFSKIRPTRSRTISIIKLKATSGQGLREGGQGGQWPRGPWILGGPWSLRGPQEGPMGFIGPIKMKPRRLFFWRSPKFEQKNRFNFGEDLFFFFFFGNHLNLKRKTVSISVKTFFFYGDHLKIRRKVCHFPCLFWTAQNQRCVIFESSLGPPSALGAPASGNDHFMTQGSNH